MKRKYSVLLIIVVLLLIMAGAANAAESKKFADLGTNDPAMPYVQYLASKGIINGYPDGTYHPNSGLTRAEAAVVICKAAGLTPGNKTASSFKDVNNKYWAKSYIAAAAQAGYLKGNPDNTFHPEQKLTRAEGITLIFRLSKSDISQASLPALSDINNKHWAAKPIAAALEAGMAGLSSDGKRFMPDAPFTRINLAQALGILLTEDPSLYKTTLPGTLTPLAGTVGLKKAGSDKETIVTQAISVGAGDTITSAQGAKAEISYPDGSSLLIKDETLLIVKAAEGRKYIRTDGNEGIAVNWLNVDLKKGILLGALATRREGSDTTEGVTGYNPAQIMAALASLNDNILGSLAANTAAPKQQAWYATAQTKKVKVQVDMPWGVAAVRGTFWQNMVSSTGQSSTACLTGSMEITAGGQTVALAQNQATQLTSQTAPPPPPAAIPSVLVQQFAQEQQWIQQTAQIMDRLQEAAAPPPPAAAAVNQPVTQPAQPTPQNTVQSIINAALQQAGISSSPNNTTASNSTNTGGSSSHNNRSGNADLKALVISVGTLSPAFNKSTLSYDVSINNSMTTMTVTPTADDSTATIKVNDTAVASGAASTPISLTVGNNTITVLVTAENGNTKTYSIKVVRAEDKSGAIVSVDNENGVITIENATDSAGIALSGNNKVSITVGTLINEQMIAFSSGNAQIPIPGLCSLPLEYKLTVAITGVTSSYNVTYEITGYWSQIGNSSVNLSDVSKLDLSTSYDGPYFAYENSSGTGVMGVVYGNWSTAVSQPGYYNPSIKGSGALYAAMQDETGGILVLEKGSTWTAMEGSPGQGTEAIVGFGCSPYVLFNNNGILSLSKYVNNAWSDISNASSPITADGALSFLVIKEYVDGSWTDTPWAVCRQGSTVAVYVNKASKWYKVGSDIGISADSTSITVQNKVPVVTCAKDGNITVWTLKTDSSWTQLGSFPGTKPEMAVSNAGSVFLSFIDTQGNTVLAKYAYAGQNSENKPQYAWVGGIVHTPDLTKLDTCQTIEIDGGDICLAYANTDGVSTVFYCDPIENVMFDTDSLQFVGADSTMQYSFDGINYTDYMTSDPISRDDIDPGIGILFRLIDSPGRMIRILPDIQADKLTSYTPPVPGSTANTTRIADITGYSQYWYKVQANPSPAPLYNSPVSSLGVTAFTAGADITINPGQHLVLIATDGNGKIKAYANLFIDNDQVAGFARAHMFMPEIYDNNPVAFLFDDYGNPLPGKIIDFYTVINGVESIAPIGSGTTAPGGRAVCPEISWGSDTQIRARLAQDIQYASIERDAMWHVNDITQAGFQQVMCEQFANLQMGSLLTDSVGTAVSGSEIDIHLDDNQDGRFDDSDYYTSMSTNAAGLALFDFSTVTCLTDGNQYAAKAFSEAYPDFINYVQFEKGLGNSRLFAHAIAIKDSEGILKKLRIDANLSCQEPVGRTLEFWFDWCPDDNDFSSDFSTDNKPDTGGLIYLGSGTITDSIGHMVFEKDFSADNTQLINNGAILVYYAGDASTNAAKIAYPVFETTIQLLNTDNYGGPVAGVNPGTSRITLKALPTGAVKWQYKVGTQNPFPVVEPNSFISGAIDYTGEDISVPAAGTHLLLLATDGGGKVKAYVDLVVTVNQIASYTSMTMSEETSGTAPVKEKGNLYLGYTATSAGTKEVNQIAVNAASGILADGIINVTMNDGIDVNETVAVTVTSGDTATAVADNIKSKIDTDSVKIKDFYDLLVSGQNIIFTAKKEWSDRNVSISIETNSLGLDACMSTQNTAGLGAGNLTITINDGVINGGSDLAIVIPLNGSTSSNEVASLLAYNLSTNNLINGDYDVSSNFASVYLTAKTAAANRELIVSVDPGSTGLCNYTYNQVDGNIGTAQVNKLTINEANGGNCTLKLIFDDYLQTTPVLPGGNNHIVRYVNLTNTDTQQDIANKIQIAFNNISDYAVTMTTDTETGDPQVVFTRINADTNRAVTFYFEPVASVSVGTIPTITDCYAAIQYYDADNKFHLTLDLTVSEPGTVYWLVQPSNGTIPSYNQIRYGDGALSGYYGVIPIAESDGDPITQQLEQGNQGWFVYLLFIDAEGNECLYRAYANPMC